MSNGNGNGTTKLILSALIGVVVAGSATWLSFGQSAVGRTEIQSIVERESSPISARLDKNEEVVQQLVREIGTIKGSQIRIETKLDTLVELQRKE